jgi:hypothetical protein
MYDLCSYVDFKDKLYFINLLVNETLDTHEKGGIVYFILRTGNDIPKHV